MGLLKAKGWNEAWIVTDAFHLPRTLVLFRSFGIRVPPSCSERTKKGTMRSHWIYLWLREVCALPWSLLQVLAIRLGIHRSGCGLHNTIRGAFLCFWCVFSQYDFERVGLWPQALRDINQVSFRTILFIDFTKLFPTFDFLSEIYAVLFFLSLPRLIMVISYIPPDAVSQAHIWVKFHKGT